MSDPMDGRTSNAPKGALGRLRLAMAKGSLGKQGVNSGGKKREREGGIEKHLVYTTWQCTNSISKDYDGTSQI